MATQKWIKTGTIGFVLLLSAVLGVISNFYLIELRWLIVLMILGLGAVFLLLSRLEFGLPILVIAAMVVPYGLGTGTESNISAAMLLLIALLGMWLLKMIFEVREIRLVPTAANLPIILFVLAAVLSFLIGQLDWFPGTHAPIRAQVGGLLMFVLSAGAFLLAGNTLKDERWLEIMVWVFMVLGFVYLVANIDPRIGVYARRFMEPRAMGSVFWIWLVSMSVSQLVFNSKIKIAGRIAAFVILVTTFYVSFFRNTVWTSGWLPPFAGIIAIVILSKTRLLYPILGIGLVAAVLNYNAIYSTLMMGDNQFGMDTRLAAWSILIEISKINMLFGLGPANYYWYTPFFRIMGYYVPFNSHNNYVDLVAQTGIIGLFFYGLFFWKIGWTTLRLRLRVPEGFPTAFVYGALGGIAGTLVAGMFGDWIIPFVYNIGFIGFRASMLGWLFLGGVVALEQKYAKVDTAITQNQT